MKYSLILMIWLLFAIEACSQTKIIPPAVIQSKGRKVIIQTADTTKITLNDSIELFQIGNDFYIKNKNYQGKYKITFNDDGVLIPVIYHDTIMISPTRGIRFDNPYSIHFFSTTPGDMESKIVINPTYTGIKNFNGSCGLYFDNNNNIHLVSVTDSITWNRIYLKLGSDTVATRAYARAYAGGGGSGTPGGSPGQLQWNDAGVFAGLGNWTGTYIIIGTDTLAGRLFTRNTFIEDGAGGGDGNIAVWKNNKEVRGEGNFRWDDPNYELEIDGRIWFGGYLISSAVEASNVPYFRLYTKYTATNTDTILEVRNNTKPLLRMYDDSTAHYGDMHVYEDLKCDGTMPHTFSIICTNDSIALISDTSDYVYLGNGFTGLSISHMRAITENDNSDMVLTVQLLRKKADESIEKLTDTDLTIEAAERIDYDATFITHTFADDDELFCVWSLSGSGTRPKGLKVYLKAD